MKSLFEAFILVNLIFISSALCQSEVNAPPAVAPAQPMQPTQPAQPTNQIISEEPLKPKTAPGYKSEILEGFYEEFVYNVEQRRDPFSPHRLNMSLGLVNVSHPLQRFTLEELKVIGIIWNTTSPKALVLDPAGTSYVVLENDKIGNSNGYVAKIREGELVIVEERLDASGNKGYLTKLMLFQKN